jgi:fructose-1,6-bisphosphatase/inositol monophosphatase family enzyme
MCSIEYYSKKDGYADRGLADFCLFARQTRKIRSLGSTAFELCRVAKGNLDFCILDTYFLDLSAAKLILEEAGGVCRTYDNTSIEPVFDSLVMRMVASSRAIEPAVRQALEKK